MEVRLVHGGFGLLLGIVLASLAQAGDYTVQIGAFRNPPADYAVRAESVGPLQTTRTAEGVTRFRIGEYASEAEADVARIALVEAGYADAFVIRARGARRVTTIPAPRTESRSGDPLAGVPAHLRSRVVLLDGVYHVKDGDRFTPLEEALRAEAGR